MNGKSTDIFILGPGNLGLSLGFLLEKAGFHVVGMWGRREASLRPSGRRAGFPFYHGPIPPSISDAGVLLVTTADGAIEEVAGMLADSGLLSGETIVYHCSGAFDSRILSAVRVGGAATGSIHPLQAIPSVEVGLAVLPSSCFVIEGDERAVETAGRIVSRIGGRPLVVPGGNRPLYHAAASMASNYMVTLLRRAAGMMAGAGLGEREAIDALMPMVKTVVERIGDRDTGEVLTGPIARGDDRTLRVQIEAVAKHRPRDLPIFLALARATLELVRGIGRVDGESIGRMRALLDQWGRNSVA